MPTMQSERAVCWLVFGLLAASAAPAQPNTRLLPKTRDAYQGYIRQVERSWAPRMTGAEPFLRAGRDPGLNEELLRGQVRVKRVTEYRPEVPGGMVHHWMGSVLVAGCSAGDVLAFLRDSESHPRVYPELRSAEVLERGPGFQRVRTRMVVKKVFTVAADTEGETFYDSAGENRWLVRSYIEKVNEIRNLGRPNERSLPDGQGSGMFWRLNSYWWLEEIAVDGTPGTMLELETIALTRGIPAGLGWLVKLFFGSVPKQSMEATMRLTRDAILERVGDASKNTREKGEERPRR